KGEAAREAAIGALHAVILPVLLLLLKHPLSRDREHIVLNRHFHVLFLDLGKLGLDEIFILILHDVHQRRPLGHRQRLVLRAVFADRRAAEQRGEPVLQFVQFPERIPTSNSVHTVHLLSARVHLRDLFTLLIMSAQGLSRAQGREATLVIACAGRYPGSEKIRTTT